jgi:hypothetical protein
MILTIINILFTIALTIGLPLVGYPFSRMIKQARQAIDDKFKWEGPDSEKKEALEDRITHASVVIVSIVVYVVIGSVYTWYVQTYTYMVNPWMYRLIPSLPVFGNAQIGYYDTLPFIYWTMVFWHAYIKGRKSVGRSDETV